MGNSCCNSWDEDRTELLTMKQKSTNNRDSRTNAKGAEITKRDDVKPFEREQSKTNSADGIVINKSAFVLSKESKFTDDYDLKEALGEGAFGVVGKWQNKDSGAIRAVKMLSK